MLRVDNELADHSLNDTYVAIKGSSYEAPKECHPKVRRKANNEKGCHGANATKDEDRLTT